MLGHQDPLQQHQAIVLQQAAAAREVLRYELVTDGLNHFDRDDLVEAAGEVAVVLKSHVYAVLHARLFDSFPGQPILLA